MRRTVIVQRLRPVASRVVRVVGCLAVLFVVCALVLLVLPDCLAAQSAKPRDVQLHAAHFLARRGLHNRRAAEQLMQARKAHSALAASRVVSAGYASSLLSQPWQSLGPAQVFTAAYGNVTGRVTAIAADPSDITGNTVYVGTTGGGVWKSTNAAGPQSAVAFTPLTDDLPVFNDGNLASLSIGAVSVQPGGTGVVLAGTGDPNDALDSYYGAGLLRSGDGGLTWSLIQNSNDFAATGLTNFYFIGQAFAGFAWSTATPNLVVAAVSQSAEGQLVGANDLDSSGGLITSVAGLYYSIDAGQTWLLSTITDGPGQVIQTASIPLSSSGNPATAIIWNPLRKAFLAAVRFHGYYESPDGITFTRLTNQPGAGLTSVECPTNPNSPGLPACPVFRGALAVQPVTGDTFALTVDAYNVDQGLWQDLCQFGSGACASATIAFGQQLAATSLEDGSGKITNADYDLWLAAAPAAGDTLLFAGTTDIFRCDLNSGCAWRNATNTGTCAAAKVAPSQHAFDATFAAPLSLMYFGNDSGLWRTTDDVDQTQTPCSPDDAIHFQNLNGGIGSLAEVNAFAQDPSNSSILLAGLGVNGDAASTALAQLAWPQVLNEYGSYVAIDPTNSQNWYAQSSTGVGIDLCPNGISCNSATFGTPVIGYAQVGNDAYAAPQPSPFLLDPQGSGNMILGTCHVWLGPADGLSWSQANLLGDLYPGEGPDCDGNSFIQSLAASGAVSGHNGKAEFLYAGIIGIGYDGPSAYAGHLFQGLSSAAAPVPAMWTDLWGSPVANDPNGFNPQDFSISSVTSDPHDATGGTIYATVEGFSTLSYPTDLLYASTSGGANWTNITSNLPDAPANSLVIDPNDANTVYVALDTGVYITTSVSTCSTQNCWSVYGSGLPNSPVIQLSSFNHGGTALLRAGTYGRGIWQVPLITSQTPLASATAAPGTLTFAPQAIQTQSPSQTVTVTNTGATPLVVSQATAGGDFTASNSCTTAISDAGTCKVTVNFTPTAIGARMATLTIYANIPGGQITVPLAGSGVAGAAIVLSPTSVSFGSNLIGVATAPAQNVTISNTGGSTVNLQPAVVTGDFSITANTCSTSLAPNFGCTVALVFTPTASGTRGGTFSVTDSVGTQTATLTGTGLSAATDSISPTALSFAPQLVGSTSASQSVTLTNTGDSSLKLITIQISGNFQAVNGCGVSLIGHSTCAIAVSYTPASTGSETGILTITDIYGKPQSVALTGTGIAPAGISALPRSTNFGSWGVSSTSSPQSVTLSNSGGLPLTGLTFKASGDFGIIANSCSTSLNSGSNCAAQIVFSPTQSGPRAGGLTIASPSLPSPFEIPFTGNGLGFTFQADGSASSTVTAGQTANYLLQIIPASGSTGILSVTCSNPPVNSTCTVNPASVQISSGVTSTVAVNIATVANSSAAGRAPWTVVYALILPIGLWWPWSRRRSIPATVLTLATFFLFLILVPTGCGVSASGGGSTPPTNSDPSATPPATYAPIIIASGPGITQTVNLTLVVE
jgi:hypothetical protein